MLALLPALRPPPPMPRPCERRTPTPNEGWRSGRQRHRGDRFPLTQTTGMTEPAQFDAEKCSKSAYPDPPHSAQNQSKNPRRWPSRFWLCESWFPQARRRAVSGTSPPLRPDPSRVRDGGLPAVGTTNERSKRKVWARPIIREFLLEYRWSAEVSLRGCGQGWARGLNGFRLL